jgi:hypothetical protein
MSNSRQLPAKAYSPRACMRSCSERRLCAQRRVLCARVHPHADMTQHSGGDAEPANKQNKRHATRYSGAPGGLRGTPFSATSSLSTVAWMGRRCVCGHNKQHYGSRKSHEYRTQSAVCSSSSRINAALHASFGVGRPKLPPMRCQRPLIALATIQTLARVGHPLPHQYAMPA